MPTWESARQGCRDVEVGGDLSRPRVVVHHASVRVGRGRGGADVLRGGARREHVGCGAGGRLLVAARLGDLALQVLPAQDVGDVVPRRPVLVGGPGLLLLLRGEARRGGEVVGGRTAELGSGHSASSAGSSGVGRRVGRVVVGVPGGRVQGGRPVHPLVGRVAVVLQPGPHGRPAGRRVELHHSRVAGLSETRGEEEGGGGQ